MSKNLFPAKERLSQNGDGLSEAVWFFGLSVRHINLEAVLGRYDFKVRNPFWKPLLAL